MKVLFLVLFLNHASTDSLEIDTAKLSMIVNEWSDAHNTHDLNKMSNLFAPKVIFYCVVLSRDECIKRKFKLLESGNEFQQNISSPITFTLWENQVIKCEFTKEVNFKGTIKHYPSYLLLKRKGADFKIIGESDKITDINLKYNLDLGQQIYSPQLSATAISKKRAQIKQLVILISILLSVILFALFYYRKKNLLSKKRAEITNINIDLKANLEVVNKNKGDAFEEFVVKRFDKQYFKLINWRSDKGINGIFPESNKYPDLEYQFSLNSYSIDFAVECKFRKEPIDGFIEIAHPDQLDRYRSFEIERKIKVYIVLGLGGTANSPDNLYLIPLDEIVTHKMTVESIEKYKKYLYSNFFFSTKTDELT